MGWVRPGFEAQVAEDGELLLKTSDPLRFSLGYFGMPEKTAEAWRDGWFHTGDRVAREPDGAFRFIDRLKDSIRRRGENVSSYEVEQVLLEPSGRGRGGGLPGALGAGRGRGDGGHHPQAGLPDRWRRRWRASARRACRTSRCPASSTWSDDLPRTENGKVQKFRLRERGVTASAIRLPRPARN